MYNAILMQGTESNDVIEYVLSSDSENKQNTKLHLQFQQSEFSWRDRTAAWQRREYQLALQLGLYTTGKTLTGLTNRNTSRQNWLFPQSLRIT